MAGAGGYMVVNARTTRHCGVGVLAFLTFFAFLFLCRLAFGVWSLEFLLSCSCSFLVLGVWSLAFMLSCFLLFLEFWRLEFLLS